MESKQKFDSYGLLKMLFLFKLKGTELLCYFSVHSFFLPFLLKRDKLPACAASIFAGGKKPTLCVIEQEYRKS